jgi:8-oxo-dGTP diphosphatase
VRTASPPLTVDVVLLAGEPPASVLLIQRANEPFAGSWALPGGFVDRGERVKDAALRELAEETDVALDSLVTLLGVYDAPGRDPRGPTISIVFVGRIPAQRPAQGGDDAIKAEWFALGALPPLAFDHAEIIADALA